jgi:hypothetical protein
MNSWITWAERKLQQGWKEEIIVHIFCILQTKFSLLFSSISQLIFCIVKRDFNSVYILKKKHYILLRNVPKKKQKHCQTRAFDLSASELERQILGVAARPRKPICFTEADLAVKLARPVAPGCRILHWLEYIFPNLDSNFTMRTAKHLPR